MSADAMVMGAFIGDAISLGPHWVYDQEEIARRIVDPAVYQDPISPYHPGKRAGNFTHYGDQMLVLLDYISAHRAFHLHGYAAAWRAYWENPATISYRDKSTRETLAALERGQSPEQAGAPSSDLAGAAKFAPLFLLEWPDDASLFAAVRQLTAFTHAEGDVIAAAAFFVRVALAVRSGVSIPDALRAISRELEGNLKAWFREAETQLDSTEDSAAILDAYGLGCSIDGGFPGVCYLLLRYPDDPVTVLTANAMAGGDSAARGMILGTLYGAADLLVKTPPRWTEELRSRRYKTGRADRPDPPKL